MKYLETKHERNSAKITALIVVILVLLLFVVGPPYLDPPEEYGVAVNFGNSEVGSGKVQPENPVASKPKEVEKEQKTEPVTKETSGSDQPSAEDLITDETEESIAIKKAKEAEAKAKAEAERIERERREKEEREQREKEEKIKNIDNLFDNINNNDGPDNQQEGPNDGPGDKGQLDGKAYAPYDGVPGAGKGGIGVGLNGRGKPRFTMQEGCDNEYGLVVVAIIVNRNGEVVEANAGEQGTTNITACLKSQAEKIAKSFKWRADSKAPARQYGKLSINFTPN